LKDPVFKNAKTYNPTLEMLMRAVLPQAADAAVSAEQFTISGNGAIDCGLQIEDQEKEVQGLMDTRPADEMKQAA